MRVVAQIDISAPPQAVWDFATDPKRTLHFMSGITRWEPVTDVDVGIGARYRMLMRVGSAEIGSLIETVEFNAPCDWAWASVVGLDQRGRMRLRDRTSDAGRPRTHIEFRLSYGVAGAGLSGWVAEHVAAGEVRRHLQRTLAQLKRQVEHEQLRADAAQRRAARGAAA